MENHARLDEFLNIKRNIISFYLYGICLGWPILMLLLIIVTHFQLQKQDYLENLLILNILMGVSINFLFLIHFFFSLLIGYCTEKIIFCLKKIYKLTFAIYKKLINIFVGNKVFGSISKIPLKD